MYYLIKNSVICAMVWGWTGLFGMDDSKSILLNPDTCFVSSYYQKSQLLKESFVSNYCGGALPDVIKITMPDVLVVEDYKFNKRDDLVFAYDGCLVHAGFYNMFDDFGNEIVFEVEVAFRGHDNASDGFLKVGFAISAAHSKIGKVFFEFNESMAYFMFAQSYAGCEHVITAVFDRIKNKIWKELNPNALDEHLSQFFAAQKISIK